MEEKFADLVADLRAKLNGHADRVNVFQEERHLCYKLEKLLKDVGRLETRLETRREQVEICPEMLDDFLKSLECVQKNISKRTVEKYGDDLDSITELVLSEGKNTTRERIDDMFDYTAYLQGKAYGIDEYDRFYPMLSEIRYGLRSIENKYMSTTFQENSWARFYEIVLELRKFESALKTFEETPADNLKTYRDVRD